TTTLANKTINLDGAGGSAAYLSVQGTNTLTLAPTTTVRRSSGGISYSHLPRGTPTLANQGTILAAHNAATRTHDTRNRTNASTAAAAVAADASNQHKTAVGYAEASAIGTSTFGGEPVDSAAVVARYTLMGDANLSGNVDLTDFTFLAANFNGTGKSWLQGDFNYDGSVNLTDFTFLASNFNQVLSTSGAPGALGSSVPEPCAGVLAAAALLQSGRWRRRFAS